MRDMMHRFTAPSAIFLSLTLALFIWLGLTGEGGQEGFNLITVLGKTGEAPGQFHEPMGLAFDADGNLYVADTRNARIQKFTKDGNFLLAWGRPGQGPGEFSKPVDVAVDAEGYVFVSDFDLDRIQVFTSGALLTTLQM